MKEQVEIVPSDALSKIFELLSGKVSLVFLNACYSEEQAKAISKHIDFVIGMSKAISDEAARKFAGASTPLWDLGKAWPGHSSGR